MKLTLSAQDFLATNRLLDTLLITGNLRNAHKVLDCLTDTVKNLDEINEKNSLLLHDLVDILSRYSKSLLPKLLVSHLQSFWTLNPYTVGIHSKSLILLLRLRWS